MHAEISACGTYRYTLERIWDTDKRLLLVNMLNPSTADHKRNDPTITTLIRFAKGWGFGGILVTNFFAFRSSHPSDLAKAEDPIGPYNQRWYIDCLQRAGAVVFAHGNYPVNAKLVDDYWTLAWKLGHLPQCMGVTKGGAPKHPLARGKHRIPSSQPLVEWPAPSSESAEKEEA